jgi:hypothetical protein
MLWEGKPHLTWLRIVHNSKTYQAHWYLRDGLHMFRLYGEPHTSKLIIELKSGIEHITPQNIEAKISTMLVFQ